MSPGDNTLQSRGFGYWHAAQRQERDFLLQPQRERQLPTGQGEGNGKDPLPRCPRQSVTASSKTLLKLVANSRDSRELAALALWRNSHIPITRARCPPGRR